MKKRFLFVVMAVVCLAFTGSAIANQVIEGGTPTNPIEYEYEETDNYVIIGTGDLEATGGYPDPNQGNLQGHAWLGGPDAVVSIEFAIGKPGFDRDTMSGYVWSNSAEGSLVLIEDDSFLDKTVGELTVEGVMNIGGGYGGEAELSIPLGSVVAEGDVNVGIGRNADGLISIEGGSFAVSGTSTIKLGDSEDPFTTGIVPIGSGEISISGGSLTAPSGSSLIVGSMGEGKLSVIGQAITAIDLYTADVTESGVVAFTIGAGPHSPNVQTINSGGHFYLADGSIIDMDFVDQGVETVLSNYDEAATERVVSLITSADLKWNETGYNVALSSEDAPGWIMSEDSGTLKLQYLGGTGDDLIVNTGTEVSPTAIAADSYRNIYIGYAYEVETPVTIDGHASISGDVASTGDTFMAYGDDCDASLTIGSGGSLNVFAGNLAMGTGSGADAKITLNADANLNVMYLLMMSNAEATPTLVGGSAELEINDSATVAAQFLMVGGYYEPGPACSVTQTGGSVDLRNNLYIGRNTDAGAEGSSYTISGGELNLGGAINVGFDNVDSSASSIMHVDGSEASISAEDLTVAQTCTLKFTVDEGADFTGDVTPIELLEDGYLCYAQFEASYLGSPGDPDRQVDPDHCAIIDLEFEPGAESLIAALPMGTVERSIDIIRIYTHWNLKWQRDDTGYDPQGSIIDHIYGFKLVDENWEVSEVLKWNVTYNLAGYGQYAALRLVYTGPEGEIPVPIADAGPDQTGVKAETIVTLDGSGSSVTEGRTIESYTWEWNDGDIHRIIDTEPTTQTYFSVGTHQVTLTVVSDIGEVDTDSVMIEVPSAHLDGDVNYSDGVNLSDFVILRNNFGDRDADM